jgi:hypothetical protein
MPPEDTKPIQQVNPNPNIIDLVNPQIRLITLQLQKLTLNPVIDSVVPTRMDNIAMVVIGGHESSPVYKISLR